MDTLHLEVNDAGGWRRVSYREALAIVRSLAQAMLSTEDPAYLQASLQTLQKAMAPDPATGKPVPEQVAQFLQQYPEAQKFLDRAKAAPAPGRLARVSFRSRPEANFPGWTAAQPWP